MEVGMLWFDNDTKTTLAVRITRAAEYYRLKYGVVPDLCLVNPSMLTGHPELESEHTGKVKVRPNSIVLPGYLWIGSEDIC
jgi:hypothetical protein